MVRSRRSGDGQAETVQSAALSELHRHASASLGGDGYHAAITSPRPRQSQQETRERYAAEKRCGQPCGLAAVVPRLCWMGQFLPDPAADDWGGIDSASRRAFPGRRDSRLIGRSRNLTRAGKATGADAIDVSSEPFGRWAARVASQLRRNGDCQSTRRSDHATKRRCDRRAVTSSRGGNRRQRDGKPHDEGGQMMFDSLT